MITRPALRYHGGKFRLAPWILQHFPSHICYVEPFGGAMSVLLQKQPSELEVYNDLDGGVVNFFKILRDRSPDLIRAIALTPYSRQEQKLSFEPCEDEFEAARRFYVRSWQSFGGPTRGNTGWRYQSGKNNRSFSVLDDWKNIDHLQGLVWRLKQVQIEQDEAIAVIRRFDSPGTLFYIDPPYELATRRKKKAYQYELTNEQHQLLAEVLQDIEGMAIVSGYPSDFYGELYSQWTIKDRPSLTNGGDVAIERLWLSPRLTSQFGQMSLFGGEQ